MNPRLWLTCIVLLALVPCASLAWSTPVRGNNPLGSLVRDALDARPIAGRVEQRLRAGSYTYLALRTADDTLQWTVSLGSGVPTGSRVTVRSMGHSESFYSPRLARTFPDLVFGIVSRAD